jgi:hypothetical protein
MMKWFVTPLVALVLGGMALVSAASADPSHNLQPPLTFTCDNGQTVVASFGNDTNSSHQAFVISSNGSIRPNSIYVVNYGAATLSTGTVIVFVDDPRAKSGQDLVTCTSVLADGTMFTLRGIFTPLS